MSDQLAIFDQGDGILVPVDQEKGVSSGERLKRQNPRIYDLVINGLAEGMGIRALARATGVHHRTIAAIRDGDGDHQTAIDTAKERTSRNLAEFIDYTSERLVEEADNIAIGSAAISLGIAIDKLRDLQGAPTAIIRHEIGVNHEQILDYYERMKRIQPVVGGKEVPEKGTPARAGLEVPEILDVDAETTVLPGRTEGRESE
jgi:hypothetical protein